MFSSGFGKQLQSRHTCQDVGSYFLPRKCNCQPPIPPTCLQGAIARLFTRKVASGWIISDVRFLDIVQPCLFRSNFLVGKDLDPPPAVAMGFTLHHISRATVGGITAVEHSQVFGG